MILSNPVTKRELRDVLKSGRALASLFLYVFLLSLAIYASWPKETEYLIKSTELARTILQYFFFSQMLLVCVLAPVFSAGSLTSEKEEGTWELLITSPIPVSSVVWGKFCSSLAFLCLLISSSIPIGTLILGLGGVSGRELLSLYLVLFSVSVLLVTVGLWCSALFHRTHSALAVSYFITLPFCTLLTLLIGSCPMFMDSPEGPAYFLGSACIACLAGLIKISRHATTRFLESPKPAGEEDITEQTGLVLRKDKFPDLLLLPEKSGRPIEERGNPMYTKETRSEFFGSGTLFVRIILQISVFLSILFIPDMVSGKPNHLFSFVTLVMLLVTPALASGSFSQERERGTLDLLLSTLLTADQIILGKLQALLRYGFTVAGFLVAPHFIIYCASLANTDTHSLRFDFFLVYLIVVAVSVISSTTISLTFSLLTLRTLTATLLTYITLVVLYAGPFVVFKLLEVFSHLNLRQIQWVTTTSPFGPLLVQPESQLLTCTPGLWHSFILCHAMITLAGFVCMRRRLARLAY